MGLLTFGSVSQYKHHRVTPEYRLFENTRQMLPMLLFATVLMKIDLVCPGPMKHYSPSNTTVIKRYFTEDEVSPDESEQFRIPAPYQSKSNYQSKVFKPPERNLTEDSKKAETEVETDVVDREDHITQYFADMFVNTDHEITSLQVAEPEETIYSSNDRDSFFEFLTSHEAMMGMDRIGEQLNR
ncbi:uncharacterized protein LOC142984069 [Anticarsia gemmatalis]|uniref:uncharacterized protein LOC142984069 n=1 Tax=Anticarsia gemmatalis TaxID=129554 RepID=UPI003F759A1D